ncbi:MAG TPA: PQQ-binding-like beta-propeller repeat protein [Thermoanaerobaculia bacterium]|nr:PQQ-binding-like beta-propeller repeat protein [Thermoanaerobaculia bacterium]
MKSWRALCFLPILLLCGAGLALAAGADPSTGTDWPQFRGPQQNGVSLEKGLLRSWPESGPKILWKKPIGSGFSTVTVVGDALYTMAVEGESEMAYRLRASDGEVVWRMPLGPVFPEIFGNGPRSTPLVEKDVVYVLSATGRLHALKMKDGSRLWEMDLVKELGSPTPQRGFATSPLVDGDLLLLEAGGTEGRAVVALDKTTGKIRWSALNGEPGYATPVAVTIDGVRQYVFVRGEGDIVSLRPDGKVHWQHPWRAGAIASPLFLPPNRIFASATDDAGAVLVEIGQAEGKATVREVWNNRLMKNHFSSSVLYEGHIYGFDNASLKCIVAETGEQKWVQRGYGKGSLIAADGLLYILSDQGQLILAEATPEGFREKGKAQVLEGRTWTAPVLSHGRLYLRNDKEMIVVDVRTPAPAAGKDTR